MVLQILIYIRVKMLLITTSQGPNSQAPRGPVSNSDMNTWTLVKRHYGSR